MAGEAGVDADHERSDITPDRRTAAQSAKWTFLAGTGSQLVRVLFVLVLAFFLTPREFGIGVQGTIYITLIQLLLEQGFEQTLIQRPAVEPLHYRTVATVNMALAVVGTALTFVFAEPLARAFDTPELADVLRVLTLAAFFKAAQIVQVAKLSRRLDFKHLAFSQLTAPLISSAAGIVGAMAGMSYWAVVLQAVLQQALTLVFLVRWAGPVSFGWSTRHLRDLSGTGIRLFLSRVLAFVGSNADNILVGLYLGARALAFYALSYRFITLALQTVGRMVNVVALPLFSRLQDDPARIGRGLLMATSAVATVSFPGLMLLILVAPVAVPLTFGPEWEPAVVPMQILAVTAMLRLVLSLMGPLAVAIDRADLVLKFTLAIVAASLVAFRVGLEWGIVGVAIAYLVVIAGSYLPNAIVVNRRIGLPLPHWIGAQVPSVVATGAMVAVYFAVLAGVRAAGLAEVPAVVVAGLASTVAFGAVILVAFPRTFRQLRELVGLAVARAG